MNFGGFATPERNIVFDINDFDETLPAPWEWDVKRRVGLVRARGQVQWLVRRGEPRRRSGVRASYRERLREVASMSPLEAWYARISAEDVVGLLDDWI